MDVLYVLRTGGSFLFPAFTVILRSPFRFAHGDAYVAARHYG